MFRFGGYWGFSVGLAGVPGVARQHIVSGQGGLKVICLSLETKADGWPSFVWRQDTRGSLKLS
jgi:hypothetical protein